MSRASAHCKFDVHAVIPVEVALQVVAPGPTGVIVIVKAPVVPEYVLAIDVSWHPTRSGSDDAVMTEVVIPGGIVLTLHPLVLVHPTFEPAPGMQLVSVKVVTHGATLRAAARSLSHLRNGSARRGAIRSLPSARSRCRSRS